MGGPLGALIGTAVGHHFDSKQRDTGLLDFSPISGALPRAQEKFYTATFLVMGHVAKADGIVTEAEIAAARGVMMRMGLSDPMRKAAIRLFNEGKNPEFPLGTVLDQFRSANHRRHSLIRMFVAIQLEAALADGELKSPKEQLLLQICDRLSFPRFEFHAMRLAQETQRRFTNHRRGPQGHREPRVGQAESVLEDAYLILGLKPSASNAEIKRAYRRMISQYHPDKLVAKGHPEPMLKHANEKTQQIRKAYETICRARNI
jgi:DnaJ like chaperone protein